MIAACVGAETGTPLLSTPTDATVDTPTMTPATSSAAVTVGEGELFLRPIDPSTLKDLPGQPQLGLGESGWAGVSPEGRWVAAASMDTPDGDNPRLTLVDRHDWSWSEPVDIPKQPWRTTSLAVTEQGTAVWIHAPSDRADVYRLPLGTAPPELISSFDAPTWPLVGPAEPTLLTESTFTMITHDYGSDHGGPISVAQIDLADGLTRHLSIGDVWYGGRPPREGDAVTPALHPGWVFDTDRRLLYVIPAERDEVVVVDVDTMQVTRRGSWTSTESLLQNLLVWWVPTAQAKTDDYYQREIALSPDGSRLYVATQTPRRSHEGIEIIDTDTFELVGSSNLPVLDVAVSPDGTWLLASGVFVNEEEEGGLYVIEADTLRTVAHIHPWMHMDPVGFSEDGSHAYALGYDSASSAPMYVVVDLGDQRPVAWRRVLWPGFSIPHVGVLAARDR